MKLDQRNLKVMWVIEEYDHHDESWKRTPYTKTYSHDHIAIKALRDYNRVSGTDYRTQRIFR